MSRRAILAAAGVTPAVLMGLSVSPDVQAQIKSIASASGLANNDGIKLGAIMTSLWASLTYGAAFKDAKLGAGILNAALGKSFQHIMDNLADFPPDGKDPTTMSCALICGIKAGEKAGAGNSITAQQFEEAWEETQTAMSLVLARARGNGTSEGHGLAC
jgi:hypothetical protein